MTPTQVAAVRRSFSLALPRADAVARSFYERLFALDPRLRALFGPDMADQRRKLMLTLGTVVQQLHQIDALLPSVRALAVRHVGYGVEERHYAVVGRALLDALARNVPEFADGEREAWGAAYAVLSSAMMDAARAEPAERSSAKQASTLRAC